jgi:hypothetical protein
MNVFKKNKPFIFKLSKSIIMKLFKTFLIALVLFACQDSMDLQKNPDQNPALSLSDSKVADSGNGLARQSTLSPYWYFFRQYPSSDLYYANSTDGVNWSGNQPFGNNAKTSRSPAAVFFQNKFHVIFKGNSTSVLYVTSSSDGINWTTSSVIPNIETTMSPAAVVYDNRIYVFVKAQSTNDLYYVHSADGISWSTPELAGNYPNDPSHINGEPSVVLTTTPNVTEFSIYWPVDASNHIQTRRALDAYPSGTINWGGSSYLNVNCETLVSSNKGLSGAYFNGADHLILKGNSSTNIFDLEGLVCPDLQSTPANTSERPSAAVYNGKMTVVCKGVSSNQIYSFSSTDGDNWTAASLAVGVTASGPALVIVP